MAYICFDKVGKDYISGEVTVNALKGVSFEIEKGEICVIVGESGAGKTTLLNILGGMDVLSSGRITVDGTEISAFKKRELTRYRRNDVGFVFQFYNLIPNLTAIENVEIAAQLCKDSMDPDKVLENVGLSDRKGNFPAQLSGGEQQRVAIARALAKNPKLLLCDEPTGALDSKSSDELLALFKKVNQMGQTVLMVTHSTKAASNASRVLFIKDGMIFHQIYKGQATDQQMYQSISDTLTLLAQGGDLK